MKNYSILIAIFALCILALGCSSNEPAPPPEQPVETPPEDLIGPISVSGDGVAPPGANPAQGKLLAKRAALLDAYRALLEEIKGVHVDSTTRVQDFVTQADDIRTMAGGYIQDISAVDYIDNGDGSWTAEINLDEEQVRKMLEVLAENR